MDNGNNHWQRFGVSEEVLNEPDWTRSLPNRIGLRDREGRFTGLTHPGDDWRFELEREASQKIQELAEKVEKGELVTVRDVMAKQEDVHLRRPEVHPEHWRYVLHTTESFIKEQQPWPINARKKQQEQQKQPEKGDRNGDANGEEKKEDPKEKYTPEQRSLIRILRQELEYTQSLQNNDGRDRAPMPPEPSQTEIDEADQNTPDNWVPRTDDLIRLTGKHPLNGEPPLTTLYEAGLITPSRLHYVRSHGAVPHLVWETHKLEITTNTTITVLVDQLIDQYRSINIPVFMACDGNRRKELNMIKRSKGFNFGPGAAGCAYWKGVLLRDVLLDVNIANYVEERPNVRLWVNFEGADQLDQGKYATSIPLEHVMDPNNDVLLAYDMNDHPLPPDHGYPLRVIIPGYVGGRNVKWLSRIWISDHENDSFYHVYDNRVLPSFVTDQNSELAEIMFRHPSTCCNEQVLNSIIVRPAQEERIDVVDIKRGWEYRIAGFAYTGGGHEVQKVEVSLDGGENWLYCTRNFPEAPIRHGKRFWTWLHWHVDVDITRLLRADSITVRCWDALKNCQPEKPTWNLEGMMNNSWYIVKPEVIEVSDSDESFLTFRHPVEPGQGRNGWLKPSTEDQMEDIRRQAAAPHQQFTREEIEQHYTEQDCWIVIDGKVVDATSVLSWHPGGPTPIMAHAGRVHAETSEEFGSIHDGFAYNKMSECILGVVTDRTMEFIKKEGEEKAKERAQWTKHDPEIALNPHKWTPVRLLHKVPISPDTYRYTFSLPPPAKKLGLQTGQHVQIGFHFSDRLIIRPYTPVRPILPSEEDGTFDIVVKTYSPQNSHPGGTLSNVLDCLRVGEEVEIKGPSGGIRYLGHGRFFIDSKEIDFVNITLIIAGTGVTPGYQLVARILKSNDKDHDNTKIKVIDANKSESDILLHDEFDNFSRDYSDQFQIVHVLSHPHDEWKGEKGHVTPEIIRKYAFKPAERNMALVCGPPQMIKKDVLPALLEWGYKEGENLFGF